MSTILQRAKAHYDGLGAKTITVPEWGEEGKPLVIHFTALTIAERRRIFRADDKGIAPDGPTAAVRAVVLKASDAAGKRLFTEMDEHDLTHKVDSTVIGRVAAAILVDAELTADIVEQAKNA